MAAAMALTACGGGGQTGPVWAQNLKETITSGDLSQLPAGEFYGPCTALTAGGTQSFVNVRKITRRNGAVTLQSREDFYGNQSCSDDSYLGSVTQPVRELFAKGTGTDPGTGQAFTKVTAQTKGGALTFTVEPEVPLIVTPNGASTKLVFSVNGSPLIERAYPTSVAPGSDAELLAFSNGALYLGDESTRSDTKTYATALDTTVQYKPFKQFDVAPGTYAQQCQITKLSTTATDYGLVVSNVYSSRRVDAHQSAQSTYTYYSDTECQTGLLFSVAFPASQIDTLGNVAVDVAGDPTSPYFLNARKISLTYAQGKPVVTLDPAAKAANLVSLQSDPDGQIVTLIQDGRTQIQLKEQEASTVFDLAYANGSSFFMGDDESIDKAVSPYPTQLLINVPFELVTP